MSDALVPQYLDMDFATMKERLKTLLEADATFKDYNYEGANITILMELFCYLGQLTTFYANQVAKNQYIETADIYETTHMLSRLRSYNPYGYVSSNATLTISVTLSGGTGGVSAGDTIKIDAWKQITCTSDALDADGNVLKFSTITDTTETIPTTASGTYTFTIPVKQGIVYTETYTGDDISNNMIFLPSYNFDYDDDLEDDNVSMQLIVNSTPWTRISDFYDDISGLLTEDDVYMMRYNKYQKYIIEFSPTRNVPIITDNIYVTLLKSAGTYGNIVANKITTPETNFIYNETAVAYVTNASWVTVTNLTAATGGSDPETISSVKDSSTAAMHSQYRNVTKNDYIGHLESKSNINVAYVWGEQEIAPSGSILEYNKVHITVIPTEWGTGTIEISAGSGDIYIPTTFSEAFKTELSTYLEPRKMLSAYEEFNLPEVIFFAFDFGIKIKRSYVFSTVANDIKNKLIYYFNVVNRSFAETISFTDIEDYIKDPANVSTTDTFAGIKGIQSLITRDINVMNGVTISTYGSTLYPRYAVDSFSGDNKVRNIELDHDQFPALSSADCSFLQEI